MKKLFPICNIVKRNIGLSYYIEKDFVSQNIYCYILFNGMLN